MSSLDNIIYYIYIVKSNYWSDYNKSNKYKNN